VGPTSNFEVGETAYRYRGKYRGEKAARDKVTERRSGKDGVEQGRAPRVP